MFLVLKLKKLCFFSNSVQLYLSSKIFIKHEHILFYEIKPL